MFKDQVLLPIAFFLACVGVCWGAGEANQAGTKPAPEAENAVKNGSFSIWAGYKGGVTTKSVGTPPNSLPQGWYGGPGVGATATYDVADFPAGQTAVPGSPKRHLRISWHTPPASDWPGEGQHRPAFRFTFLEYFGINDARRFAGQTVVFRFYARVAEGSVNIVPILWHSYDAQTAGIVGVKGRGYELFEASGKAGRVRVAQGAPNPAAVCSVTTRWQKFEKQITLPEVAAKSLTAGHYTGVGFDFDARSASTLDLSNIEVRSASTATSGARAPRAPQ